MGLVYGTIVNATSNYRNKKDDAVNHFTAAMLTFPVIGMYSKRNLSCINNQKKLENYFFLIDFLF